MVSPASLRVPGWRLFVRSQGIESRKRPVAGGGLELDFRQACPGATRVGLAAAGDPIDFPARPTARRRGRARIGASLRPAHGFAERSASGMGGGGTAGSDHRFAGAAFWAQTAA